MIPDATSTSEIGTWILCAIAVGNLFLIIEKVLDRTGRRRKERNGGAIVTKADLSEFIHERRLDMDYFISEIVSTMRQPGCVSPTPQWKLLHIEDDPNDRAWLRRNLGNKFEIDEAYTLEQAVNMMKQKDYSCALLDLNLPDAQGEDTLKRFRAECPTACAVIITGSSDTRAIQISGRLGFDSHVFKGIGMDPGEVARKITSAIMRHKGKQ